MFFLALHSAHVLSATRFDPGRVLIEAGLDARKYSIGADGGYAEWFEYALLALIVIMLARLALLYRRSLYVAFLLVFIYCLADNSLQIHEDLGRLLAGLLGFEPALGLRAQDFGELAVWVLFGIPLLGFLCFGLLRSDGRHRTVGLTLTAWFLAFLFFGIVVDMLHRHAMSYGALTHLVGLIEDGGEMAVIVGIFALTLAVPGFLRAEAAVVESR